MPETILVVEDEPALQETLAYNLKANGYAVETASDGRAGIEAARRLRPDLIVLDVMLPAADGFEVCPHRPQGDELGDHHAHRSQRRD